MRRILERGGDPATPDDRTVVLVHGNVSSALFRQEILRDLPPELRDLSDDPAATGSVTELELTGVGHGPHLERPDEFRAALLQLIAS